jgi:hypothetical protein
MAESIKNRYEHNALKAKFAHSMQHGLDTEHNIKNTAIETGKDLLIGVVGGGLVGAAIGKPSLITGIAVTGIGHFLGHRWLSLFGVGVMAANGFQSKSLNKKQIDHLQRQLCRKIVPRQSNRS